MGAFEKVLAVIIGVDLDRASEAETGAQAVSN